MSLSNQLRVLTLHEGQDLSTSVFRLERGWNLHFVLGPSLANKTARIFTNQPETVKEGFKRERYRELSWQNYSQQKSDVYDNFAELPLVLAGSYNYYFTVDGSADNKNGSGYLLVDPVLKAGKYDERIQLDCITCQTVLTKSLGPFPQWKSRLQVAKESGYNLIHFTPLQELGASNSCYSLADQHKLNHVFSTKDKKYGFEDVAKLVEFMRTEWQVMSLTDLVFNHTANESEWIQKHPEAVYNVVNTPHLKPAYLLDRILWHLSLDAGQGKWLDHGLPSTISSEDHLTAIRRIMFDILLPKYKIHEYFLLHIDDVVQQFRSAVLSKLEGRGKQGEELIIIPDPQYRRLKSTVNIPLALHLFNTPRWDASSEEDRVNKCCDAFRGRLQQLNDNKYREVQSHMEAAVGNLIANARYRFLDPAGPRCNIINAKQPIMYNYFLLPEVVRPIEEEEAGMFTSEGQFCMAHNGWVMGDDPLRNFAEPGSNVYLRRELIPWGDSVKLKYGKKPEDSPYLWEHMRQYTVNTAKIFQGVRLDNCHSTPIHVAEYMLDEARKVRPDLYVIAELFTSSEHTDNIFINRLGLTSLIREAMAAWNSHEQGRLVHRYGGQPVGAMMQPPARPLVPCMAHAIFFDQTHDNQSYTEKRTALDQLPSAALVAMATCASGSNRGFDEFVPHHINVVTEDRLYQTWSSDAVLKEGQVNLDTGIMAAKKALNNLHQDLGAAGFNQVYVDQVDQDIVSVTRHNPTSHQSVILIARTVFGQPANMHTGHIPPLVVPGLIDEVILEARTVKATSGPVYKKSDRFINGLPEYKLQIREHIKIFESDMLELRDTSNKDIQEVDFVNFPPGSIVAVKVSLNSNAKTAILAIRQCLQQFGYRVHTYSGRNLQEINRFDLETIISRLSFNDLNRVLYRCDAEERDDGKGTAAYDIPGFGPLVYCGLQGVISVLNDIRAHNDLGHPVCENLRNGDWLPHYISSRLIKHRGTYELGQWFEQTFVSLSQTPRYLIPAYFDAIVLGVFMIVEEVAWAKMSKFVSEGSSFVRALAMGSMQFCSYVPTAKLPVLSSKLVEPAPPMVTDESTKKKEQVCASLAAGLPHFASGIFRNWGRDTFIALRGLLLLTGRCTEARFIILAYAGCLRHGLIPNLLGSGACARYNCRDAVWWWLHCIKDYCHFVPQGEKILQDQVSRLYPTDDAESQEPGAYEQPLSEVIQEALQRHADGVKYRERNAGPGIDRDMTDAGFNNSLGIDWQTGFVCGGNVNNCGTWMDKMGSSDFAGNKGKPATPRDGSAVELVGLCKSVVTWLAELAAKKKYPYTGVYKNVSGQKVAVPFKAWSNLILENFEQQFWVNGTPVPGEQKPELINKRAIYKDSVNASQVWADYQLRPNFPITMVVAPELFTPENAWAALSQVQDILLGPLGMKTLDPRGGKIVDFSDWAYNGNYVNSDQTNGFNYHQGPEWVWPLGYFLRAKLYFAEKLEKTHPGILAETIGFIRHTLSAHNVHLRSSPWRSLPELTNKDGAECHDSCEAQAWSMGCILEVMHDLERLETRIAK